MQSLRGFNQFEGEGTNVNDGSPWPQEGDNAK
jgi:hypothetical protein